MEVPKPREWVDRDGEGFAASQGDEDCSDCHVQKPHHSFGQKFFLQQVGGPIGLRSTCCIARLTMLWWDDKLLEVLEKMNIRIVVGACYMNDIRVWLRAIRLGWRVVDGILQYRDSWRLEELEMGMTALQKTTEIMRDVMNSVCGWLRLTMETEDMFDGWLPTLDLQIQMTEENK